MMRGAQLATTETAKMEAKVQKTAEEVLAQKRKLKNTISEASKQRMKGKKQTAFAFDAPSKEASR